MAGLIPQPFIDDLLARTDIVDVVSARLKLKKSGKNHSALCPFHQEKSPSFSVNADKQFYYCFGCGAAGNAIGFVMEFDRLDFPEAVEELANKLGLEVPRDTSSGNSPEQKQRFTRIFDLLESASQYFQQQLREHEARPRAVNYLKQRKLSGAIARQFGIGYAPPGWDNLLQALKTPEQGEAELLEVGLLVENEEKGTRYDRFRDRIIFPIRDPRGRTIGFGGRVLGDDKPKYLNSPETPVFHKGQELYGLYEARQANRQLQQLLVVEGYMDVVALAQHGIHNAVATLGTATTADHIQRLFKLVPEIIFCFDGDAAGRKAAWRALESCLSLMDDGRQCRFLFLPEGEDPDSLVQKEGANGLRARIQDQALPLDRFLFEHLSQDLDLDSPAGSAQLTKLAIPLLQQLPVGTFRSLMQRRLANLTGLEAQELRERIDEAPVTTTAEARPAQRPPQSETPAHFSRAPFNNQPRQRHEVSLGILKPTQQALFLLLRYPQIVHKTPAIDALELSQDAAIHTLLRVIKSLQSHPQPSLGALLGELYATELLEEVLAPAHRNPELPTEDPATLYAEIMRRIDAQARQNHNHQRMNKLVSDNQGALTSDEKQTLKELIRAKRESLN
ncbi:DNA primase [Aestuariirhabdus litorea]|uniref:DNA primase n=1 Tax=Aestuariirhabdus litorea TaxID=2528527 RepID=A0A3P3VNS4_9GAMM|nr:DNA primase [Aestuariirhabdus litorea]RRJ83359.1 DNA primase [Aestuariirhabdus litorea]RWW93518.1 DNA primase [Endozoicomonadaceae bacterium GTF-13]